MDDVTVWRNIVVKLDLAVASAESAVGLMEQHLDVPHISENLMPLIDGLERFHSLAKSKVEEAE